MGVQMKIGVIVLALCFMSACSTLKPGCIVQNQGTAVVTGVIVAQLQCSNVAVVQADVLAAFEKLNLCPAAKTGPIADSICPAVTQMAVGFLADQAIPASWGCSAANAKAALASAVEAACKKLPY